MRDMRLVWVYSRKGLLEHFRHCREARKHWNSSGKSTIEVEEPARTRLGVIFYGSDT